MTRTGYAKGVNSGHVTEQRPKKAKPSYRKGRLGKRTALCRELAREVMGLAPYEVIELLVASAPETCVAKTQKGELPLEIAQRKRAPSEVVELLEKMIERLLDA